MSLRMAFRTSCVPTTTAKVIGGWRGKSHFKPDKEKKFRIGIIADLDAEHSRTRKKFEWKSYFKTGYLKKDTSGKYKVKFKENIELRSNLSCNGRGQELSELCRFNGNLYACDDSTGVIFQIVNNEPIPWVILQDGDGLQKRPFKCEWMTRKDNHMYVGSTGKEYTDAHDGHIRDTNRMFVKRISPQGVVTHVDWREKYLAIRAYVGISFPGYMIHEAVEWSAHKQRWMFLPRRMSMERYDGKLDERRATNVLISVSEDFTDMSVVRVGELNPLRGFSTFKFIPGTEENMAVALKTVEDGEKTSTYVTIFDVTSGKIILPDQWIDDNKYEGIEFLDYN